MSFLLRMLISLFLDFFSASQDHQHIFSFSCTIAGNGLFCDHMTLKGNSLWRVQFLRTRYCMVTTSPFFETLPLINALTSSPLIHRFTHTTTIMSYFRTSTDQRGKSRLSASQSISSAPIVISQFLERCTQGLSYDRLRV
jgi:hypothetical protein